MDLPLLRNEARRDLRSGVRRARILAGKCREEPAFRGPNLGQRPDRRLLRAGGRALLRSVRSGVADRRTARRFLRLRSLVVAVEEEFRPLLRHIRQRQAKRAGAVVRLVFQSPEGLSRYAWPQMPSPPARGRAAPSYRTGADRSSARSRPEEGDQLRSASRDLCPE